MTEQSNIEQNKNSYPFSLILYPKNPTAQLVLSPITFSHLYGILRDLLRPFEHDVFMQLCSNYMQKTAYNNRIDSFFNHHGSNEIEAFNGSAEDVYMRDIGQQITSIAEDSFSLLKEPLSDDTTSAGQVPGVLFFNAIAETENAERFFSSLFAKYQASEAPAPSLHRYVLHLDPATLEAIEEAFGTDYHPIANIGLLV